MRKLLLLALVLSVLPAFAGGDNYHIGARSTAMGGATVTGIDLWSAHHNQAGLGWLQNASAGVYYESRFLLKELGIGGFVFAYPTSSGTFALHATQFGYAQYNETKISLDYGMALNEKIAVGVGLNYQGIRVAAENYGNKTAFTAEVGVMAKLTDELTIGAHVFNLTRAKLAPYNDERIPTNFRLGIGYQVSSKVVINAETEKDIDHEAMFKVGVEYRVMDLLYLRGGISTEPTLTSFGFGLVLNNFLLDFSSNIHPTLGITPQFSLTYQLTKNPNASVIQ